MRLHVNYRMTQDKYEKLIRDKVVKECKQNIDSLIEAFKSKEDNINKTEMINFVSTLNIEMVKTIQILIDNGISLRNCYMSKHFSHWSSIIENKDKKIFKYKYSDILNSYVLIYPDWFDDFFNEFL